MAVNLFDANYYRKANADLAKAGITSDAQLQGHFQQYGLNEGRSFSPFADLNFYRASNSDLAGMTNQQAYDHLQQYGVTEGRTFSQFVDLNFYKSANGDLAGKTNQQAFEHLQQYGVAEGRTFSQFFNSDYYRRTNSDLPSSLNNRQLLEHLEQYGLDEGRDFSADFDAKYYRNANSDLAAARLNNKQLYNHFRLYGIAESRDSSPIFNVKSYLQDANNADLRRLNFNSTQAHEHFNLYGYKEGRFGCADYAGNTLSTARAIDLSSNNATFKDFVGANDTDDYYRFTLTKPTSSKVTLDGLGANANVELIADANNNGTVDDKEVIKSTNNSPTNKDVFSGSLKSGTYYIHVSASGTANTSYQLKLSTDAATSENKVPVLDLNGSADGNNFNASFNENKGAVAIVDSDKLSITDADDTTLKSAKIAISNLFDGEAEKLAAKTDDTKIAADYDSKTGVLSLSGDDTLANYQKVLRSVTYNNTSQNPDNADRKIQFTINDGKADSEIATSTVSVNTENDVLAVDLNGSDVDGIDYTTSFNIGKGAVAAVDSAKLSVSGGDDLASATVKISNLTDDGDELLAAKTGDTKITAKYDATNGTLSLTGQDTAEHYQQVLSSITYNNNSTDPNTSDRKIQFTINDGKTDSEIATSTVSFNNASVLDLNGLGVSGIDYATSFTEGDKPVAIVDSAKLSVSDENNDQLKGAKITISNPLDGEAEELTAKIDGTKITTKYDATTGELSLSGDDTLANYEKVLRTLTYNNKSLNPDTTDREIKFTVNDGVSDSDTARTTVTVNAINTVPSLDLNGSSVDGIDYNTRFIIGGNAVAIVDKDNLSITDNDNTQMKSATVQITNRQDGSSEVLAATKTGKISSSYNYSTGILKLTGEDTLANYQQVLRSVTYNNTALTPNTADRTITFKINDGTDDSELATSTVSVSAKSDVPVVDLNGSEDGKDYSGAVFSIGKDPVAVVDSTKIKVADNDSTMLKKATVKIDNLINGSSEMLNATTGETGINSNYDPTSGILTLTGEASLADYQTVLGSVTYANTLQNPTTTTRNITFTIDDGTAESEIATSKVSFNKVPVVDLNGSGAGTAYSATFTEDKGAVAIVDKANLTVTDGNNTQLKGATITITNKQADDVLAATSTGSIKSNYNAVDGILTLTGDDTLANYRQVLRSVTYNNTSQNPNTDDRTIEFKINDGITDSAPATSTVTVNPVNDTPVVALNNSIIPSFTEDDLQNAPKVAANLTITDVDNLNLAGATVKITNLQNGSDEVLNAFSMFLSPSPITQNYDAATGTLTLTGNASLAEYQEVLRTVSYANNSQNPGTTARNITFTVNDGTISSNIVTSTVAVKAVNDAPVVDLDGSASEGINYNVDFTGSKVSIVDSANLSVTDVDSTQIKSATVKITNNQFGDVLEATKAGNIISSYDSTKGALTLTGFDTLANYQQVLRSVTYNNTSSSPNTDNRTINFTINDGSADNNPVATSTVYYDFP